MDLEIAVLLIYWSVIYMMYMLVLISYIYTD